MIELTNTGSINRVADWLELYVICESEALSKSEIASHVSTGGRDLDESEIDSILSELEFRGKLYGSFSPFEIKNNRIEPKVAWKEYPEYTMCLVYSSQGVKDVTDGGTKLFERLSSEALKSYLNGKSIVMGFPNSLNLKEQIIELSQKSNEYLGEREPLSTDNDRGVDVIGWKPFGDMRNNQLIVLLQCAAGTHWRTKKQIPLKSWIEFIRWGLTPVPGIAIPQIASLNNWNNIVDEYNFVFDRARITRCLDKFVFEDAGLSKEITAWCESKLD
ncbi:MAG: hypothetical protein KAJ07_02870 [Planctomycetes bacterium]|nr:hypothetical protein [Planctomycetota bacterium]